MGGSKAMWELNNAIIIDQKKNLEKIIKKSEAKEMKAS